MGASINNVFPYVLNRKGSVEKCEFYEVNNQCLLQTGEYRPYAEGGDGGRDGGGGPADDGGHPDVAHPQQEVLNVQVQDPGNAIQWRQ